MTTDSSRYLSDLHKQIDRLLNLEEVRTLCFDLGVDFDNVAGDMSIGHIGDMVNTGGGDYVGGDSINVGDFSSATGLPPMMLSLLDSSRILWRPHQLPRRSCPVSSTPPVLNPVQSRHSSCLA